MVRRREPGVATPRFFASVFCFPSSHRRIFLARAWERVTDIRFPEGSFLLRDFFFFRISLHLHVRSTGRTLQRRERGAGNPHDQSRTRTCRGAYCSGGGTWELYAFMRCSSKNGGARRHHEPFWVGRRWSVRSYLPPHGRDSPHAAIRPGDFAAEKQMASGTLSLHTSASTSGRNVSVRFARARAIWPRPQIEVWLIAGGDIVNNFRSAAELAFSLYTCAALRPNRVIISTSFFCEPCGKNTLPPYSFANKITAVRACPTCSGVCKPRWRRSRAVEPGNRSRPTLCSPI